MRLTCGRATTSIAIGLALITTCAAIAARPRPVRTWPHEAYLLQHTALLQGFTRDFQKLGTRYHALAQATSFDYARLWATRRGEVSSLLRRGEGGVDRG